MFKFTAHDLRHHPTRTEMILWEYLRARRMVGLKFRRQHPTGPYIVDFVCLKMNFVIEVDGPIHEGKEEYDRNRDLWIKSQGFTVMRIKNEELENNRDAVIKRIKGYLLKRMGF